MADAEFKLIRACQTCGSTDKYPDGKCRLCVIARNAAYRAKNKQKAKAYAAAYHVANIEKIRATKAIYLAANKEKIKQGYAAYHAANKDKLKASCSAYRLANPEKVKLAYANYRKANLEKTKIAQAIWIKANSEKRKATTAAWAKANPEACRINHQNRAARKRENGGRLSKGIFKKLFLLQRGKCACCDKPLGGKAHLDHIMPIALGGMNTDENIQLLRQTCNLEKHAKHPIDFMQQRGFLL